MADDKEQFRFIFNELDISYLEVGKVNSVMKSDKEEADATDDLYDILKDAGFEIEPNGDGTYNILDKKDGGIFLEGVQTASEAIRAVAEYVEVSALTDLQKKYPSSEQMNDAANMSKIADKFQWKDITD